MKKLSILLLTLLTLSLAACTADDPIALDTPQGENVRFLVKIPTKSTRAVASGDMATVLTYCVFDKDGNFKFKKTLDEPMTGPVTTIDIPLVEDMEYNVAFFAQSVKSQDYYKISDAGVLEITYGGTNGCKMNDDAADAFYAQTGVFKAGGDDDVHIMSLKRPFTQVNIGTSDYDDAKKAGVKVTKTGLKTTADIYTKFDFNKGDVVEDSNVSVEFDLCDMPEYTDSPATLKANEQDYSHLAMAYFLAPKEGGIITKVTMSYDHPKGTKKKVYESIPLHQNHRANVVGPLLTKTAEIEVFVDSNFDMSWNGVTVKPPVFDDEGNCTISSPEQFMGFVETVTPGNTYKGLTVTLNDDIDLNYEPFTPIGKDTGAVFEGTFDGNGHTISYAWIPGDEYDNGYGYGLFYDIRSGGVVKNLTLEYFYSGDYGKNICGAVAGYAYNNVLFENITVEGGEITGYGKVGAILGMAADPVGTTVLRNCKVKGTDIYGTYNCATYIGLAQNNVVLEDCSAENVTWYEDEYEEYEEFDFTGVAEGTTDVFFPVKGWFWKFYDEENGFYIYYPAWADLYTYYTYDGGNKPHPDAYFNESEIGANNRVLGLNKNE